MTGYSLEPAPSRSRLGKSFLRHTRKQAVPEAPETSTRGHSFLFHCSIEQKRELARFLVDAGLELRELPFHGPQAIRHMQAGEHGHAVGIDVAGALRDLGHELVHNLGETLDLAR